MRKIVLGDFVTSTGMGEKIILAGIVKVNGPVTDITWKRVRFKARQLSDFQHALINEYPHLNDLSATGIILKNRIEMAENEGLLFFMEGIPTLGSEDSSFRDHRKFIKFLKVLQHFNTIGKVNDWNFEKIKAELFTNTQRNNRSKQLTLFKIVS
jgi:hypothetical protein